MEKCFAGERGFKNLKELITAKGDKEAEAHGGEVENALGHDKADGEEQVGGRDEGEDQEAKAAKEEEDEEGRGLRIKWIGRKRRKGNDGEGYEVKTSVANLRAITEDSC